MNCCCSRWGALKPMTASAAIVFIVTSLAAFGLAGPGRANGEEAQWIWSPEHEQDAVPETACYFRKTIHTVNPSEGNITIAADDAYELYVNSRLVAKGEISKRLSKHDVSKFLRKGTNVVAVKVTNRKGETGSLAARVMIRERSGAWAMHPTDESWKTNLSPLPLWNMIVYSDTRWDEAQSFGPLAGAAAAGRSKTAAPSVRGDLAKNDREATENRTAAKKANRSDLEPAGDGGVLSAPEKAKIGADTTSSNERFRISREFEVQTVLDHDKTGSLIAMTFNEFGHVIASQENGPLYILFDSDRDHTPDLVRVYCDKVKNCQGLLALNGEVFVTGDGPDGAGLYRLADKDRDGKLEDVRTLVQFSGDVGEHGPHGVALGPEGLLYVIVGNHSSSVEPYDAASPHQHYYEGDLVPRYEDPGGHATGVKAPGGIVLRTSIDGGKVELVAGGIRNAYDLAFNRDGELFTHDSDMESDESAPWYRPTRLCHITAGSEFGWRSGWASWPDYFVDSLPPVLETGRGSPTGMTFYGHHMFPARFHNTLFVADWSEGRILAVHMKRNGASYTASSEVFLEGEPLNATDLEVGPDGWLYFVTGGRGTSGGLYRVRWRGQVPESVRNLGDELTSVVRYPQLDSAWARQAVASLKNKLGDRWDSAVQGVATTKANPAHYRTRALDLMQLFGPSPTPELLIELSKDTSETVRAKAASLMGLHVSLETTERLREMLTDGDRAVRRKACEALARSGETASWEELRKMLASDDRHEAWAARRLLERLPVDEWRREALSATDHRLAVQGGLALVLADASPETSREVIDRLRTIMRDFVSDRDFIDILRVMQVAVLRGELAVEDLTALRGELAEEFPSGSDTMNREIIRMLAFLNASSINDRYVEYLQSEAPFIERLHVALHLRFISGWTDEQCLAILKFYEEAGRQEGGNSYTQYVANVTRDFARSLSPEQSRMLLAKGDDWPSAALGALYTLPAEIDDETFEEIKQLDRRLASRKGDDIQRLKVGLAAVLARCGDDRCMGYLREIWDQDPERREAVAMGLAQAPDGVNYPYLVNSLPLLTGAAAHEVLQQLASAEPETDEPAQPESLRQVILLGLKLKDEGGEHALALLEKWTGENPAQDEQSLEESLEAWQSWFAETYPESPVAALPVANESAKYKIEELFEFLTGEEAAAGSASRGATVFTKANCHQCHRFGDVGESMGPDLSSVAKRFSRREILEAIYFPSHVISSQYASKTIVTSKGRSYTGIVAEPSPGELVVLGADGRKTVLEKDEVEEMMPSKKSAMPEGLLDTLTLEEIADLFAYLSGPPRASVSARPIVEAVQETVVP